MGKISLFYVLEKSKDCRVHTRGASEHRKKPPRQETLYPLHPSAAKVGGQPVVNVVVTDIAGRTRAGVALQESDDRLKLALASSHMGVWQWNAATGKLFWSPECFDIFGSKDLNGTFGSFKGLFHPEDASRVVSAIRHVSMGHPLRAAGN